MSARKFKPIFVVGPHRAGSTLWHNLIAMSPEVFRLTDPRFLGRPGQRDFKFFLNTQVRDLAADEDVDMMVDLCFSKKAIPGLDGAFWRFEGIEAANDPELKRAVARRVKRSDRTLGAVAKAILEELTRFTRYERYCVKFPVDVLHMATLIEWFPDCRIVHITRDPRALAMSKRNDPSGTAIKTVEHPRLAWLIRKGAAWLAVRQYRLAARMHGKLRHLSNYRLFRYEDLLADPESTLRELCHFIDVDFREDMLTPEKGRHEHQPSSLTGKRRKGFDAEAAIRWREIITPVDNLLISLLTRGSMKKLGYDAGRHPIYQRREWKSAAGSAAKAAA